MKMIRILVVLMIALSGCSNTPFKGNEVVGADEFVIDSYKIKEGKLQFDKSKNPQPVWKDAL